jgi:hypothetical protein
MNFQIPKKKKEIKTIFQIKLFSIKIERRKKLNEEKIILSVKR